MAEISKTTDQALLVLLRLSEEGPMTTGALTRALGLNRTVVHRLLTTLHERGFATKQQDGYALGAMLVRIAQQVEPELRVAAKPVLAELVDTFGETLVLHVADDGDAVVLDQALSHKHVLHVEHRIGSRHPIAKGASGRALLAFLSQRSIDRVVGQSDRADALRADLDQIRTLGYAVSHDELQQGVHGLAVPILDQQGHAIASLGMIVPTRRTAALQNSAEELIAGAGRIASSLTSGSARAAGEPDDQRRG